MKVRTYDQEGSLLDDADVTDSQAILMIGVAVQNGIASEIAVRFTDNSRIVFKP